MAPENAPRACRAVHDGPRRRRFQRRERGTSRTEVLRPDVARPGTRHTCRVFPSNARGRQPARALSVYDSGKPGDTPTLDIRARQSPQLDPDYTSIGFVEAGMSVVDRIAETPTVGDHRASSEPDHDHWNSPGAPPGTGAVCAKPRSTTTDDDGTSVLAAVLHSRLRAFRRPPSSRRSMIVSDAQRIISLTLIVALLDVLRPCGLPSPVAGRGSGHGRRRVVRGGAIAMFKLMGRFEQPDADERARRCPQPRTHRWRTAPRGWDRSSAGRTRGRPRQRDASAGRLGRPRRRVRVAVQEDGGRKRPVRLRHRRRSDRGWRRSLPRGRTRRRSWSAIRRATRSPEN